MPRTRLFHTLIVCGAALTGGAVGTITTAVTLAGCDSADTGYPTIEAQLDMAVLGYPDILAPRPVDFARTVKD